ncbi:MAG: hypothetical protein JXQ83_13480 [Candidatus Glassbacteria bacterium]|nr:hypothetical protein [Candidatus Glassbacteria bacterium]
MAKTPPQDSTKKRKVGFIGCPPAEVMARFRRDELIDLDNLILELSVSDSEKLLPATTCRIIKRILDNALGLELDLIIFDDGYSKCDNARFLGRLLESQLKEVPLIHTQNDSTESRGTPVSDSGLSLSEKVSLILEDLARPSERKDLTPCPDPPAGFWGVPCADESIYDLFPRGTLVLGWLRCCENRTPADLELECWVPPGLPTVFFAQTFCSKNILAKHLAAEHNGLYLDVDGTVSRSERAKVEAFLHFRKAGH